jgi:hypothetical protein
MAPVVTPWALATLATPTMALSASTNSERNFRMI